MKILKQKEVALLTGLSRVTIWRLEQAGQFPSKLALSPNRVGWIESEVMDWVHSRQRVQTYRKEVA
jgi:predicted DNA-binding transcriptional regulator AlpA